MSNRGREWLIHVIAGTAVGAVILGVGGRVVMATLPLLSGARPRFSWGGSLEVVLLGTLYGTIGGALLAAVHGSERAQAWWIRGPTLGLLLFAVAWASSEVGRATAVTAPVGSAAVWVIAGTVFIAYGAATVALARAMHARFAPPGVRAA